MRVANLIDTGEAAYCDPILFELLSGAREEEIPAIREALGLGARLEFTADVWEQAAALEKTLRKNGVTVPRDDLFVVGASLWHRVPLLAKDRHFEIIRDAAVVALRLL